LLFGIGLLVLGPPGTEAFQVFAHVFAQQQEIVGGTKALVREQ
jgi:hypothetical protein